MLLPNDYLLASGFVLLDADFSQCSSPSSLEILLPDTWLLAADFMKGSSNAAAKFLVVMLLPNVWLLVAYLLLHPPHD